MNFFESVSKMVLDAGEAIGSTASCAGQTVVYAAIGTGEAIGSTASYAGQAVVGTAVGFGEAISSVTVQATQTIVMTTVGTGEAIGNAAIQTTQTVGYAFDLIANNPLFQQVKNALPQDWVVVLDKVDLVQAETEVRRLQQALLKW
jgi:hypothetical protein